MKEFIIKESDLNGVFSLMREDFEIYGPKNKQGEIRLSNSDEVDYALLKDFNELCWEKKSAFSAKEFFLPVTEDLMTFNGNGGAEAVVPTFPPRIIFLRPCDTHALKRMDAHFLGNFNDTNYEKRRAETLIFVMECTESWESCFCQTMKTDKAEEYDIAIRKVEDNEFLVSIKNKKLERFFSFAKKQEKTNLNQNQPENAWHEELPEIDETVNSFQVWDEYGKRCIGCGACNFVCPTCFCFTMRDEKKDENTIVRQRVWSSCQVKGFAKVAGNYEYRESQADKGRFKFLHKFFHFKATHGMDLCVGCGRCVEACPEYIDIRENMAKVNIESKLAKMGEDDESIYTKTS